MKIADMKVRATELLPITRGAKATITALRGFCTRVRSHYRDTGKTGVSSLVRSSNRRNKINRARVDSTTENLGRPINEDHPWIEAICENQENEMKELLMLMSDVPLVDCDRLQA